MPGTEARGTSALADSLLRIQINEKMKTFRTGSSSPARPRPSPREDQPLEPRNVNLELEGMEARVRHPSRATPASAPRSGSKRRADRLYEYDFAMIQASRTRPET